jgi:CBS domain-containing protein
VSDVASRPVKTVDARATLFETLLFMLEQHVHHAPIADGGRIVGVITDTDLLRLQVKSPLYLLRNVERMTIPDDLPRYAQDVAAMVDALHSGGLDAVQIGPVVSTINKALLTRLLKETDADLGGAPAPYAFVVFGSEGRREQTLLTDQDNALVYADEGDAHRAYYETLAQRVVDRLLAAGFPRCPGGFMAITWNRSRTAWEHLFRDWVANPEPRALMEALNFFDFRPVSGDLALDSLEERLLRGGREPMFLAHFARASLALSPPIGPFRHIRQEQGGVDLKKGGIVPIVGLARLYALEAQSSARNTLDRLAAAAAAGTLSTAGAATLSEAFRFLMRIRLRSQLRALKRGQRPDSRASLDDMSPLERQQLKDVFLAVRELQHATAVRHAIGRLA